MGLNFQCTRDMKGTDLQGIRRNYVLVMAFKMYKYISRSNNGIGS